MTSLVRIGRHVDDLRALFAEVAAEGVMDLDAAKESNLVASDARLQKSTAKVGIRRWAILDENERVIGYLSGRFGGEIPTRSLARTGVGAFIAMVLLARDARRAGHGRRAVQEFARLARAEKGATVVGLRLDETGDVAVRRLGFESIGFKFVDLVGVASVDELLASEGAGE